MAKMFLGQMKTRVCSALIASKILKSLAKYAPDHNSKDKISSEADDFETYAIECIRCSYFYDHGQACELIMRRVNLYGEVTCLQMAIAADDKKFLYEDACNALLTNIWYDKEDPAQERTLLVINLLTMGISEFFISAYEKHYDKQQMNKPQANVSYQMHNGIFIIFYLFTGEHWSTYRTTVSVQLLITCNTIKEEF
jgi:hypothetical protein